MTWKMDLGGIREGHEQIEFYGKPASRDGLRYFWVSEGISMDIMVYSLTTLCIDMNRTLGLYHVSQRLSHGYLRSILGQATNVVFA